MIYLRDLNKTMQEDEMRTLKGKADVRRRSERNSQSVYKREIEE